ncbi:MAG: hypothetical protein Q8L22_23435 [Reyranella sp.]|nr:hypothetical protein [Reyranella sp.]
MNRAFLTIAVLGASVIATVGAQAQSSTPYSDTNSKGQMASWTPTAEASYTKSVIQRAGYSSVSDLARGSDGSWHATAMKNNAKVAVTVDRAGQVSAN